MSSKGDLFILSAPSGTGKTSLANRVLEDIPRLKFSVSYTTREPRTGERNGVEYFFVNEDQFKEMILRQAFLEHAYVYGHYYGTSSDYIHDQLSRGHDVLLDIDVQGAMKVKEKVPGSILVFVLPPSYQVLEERLRGRGLDDAEVIESRLQIARDEIKRFCDYDYFIVNELIEDSANELKSIILASRCRSDRRMGAAEGIVQTFMT
jgi:guanylate kinase